MRSLEDQEPTSRVRWSTLLERARRDGERDRLMGADGPGKAEISATELARTRKVCDDWEQVGTELIPKPRMRLFCDEWEQASHSGDISRALEQSLIDQEDVTQLGAVLAGESAGRQSPRDITVFDSTGLAIQDLAIALACMERANELDLATVEL